MKHFQLFDFQTWESLCLHLVNQFEFGQNEILTTNLWNSLLWCLIGVNILSQTLFTRFVEILLQMAFLGCQVARNVSKSYMFDTSFVGILAFYPYFLKNFSNISLFWNYLDQCLCFETQFFSKSSFNEKLNWFKIELCPNKLEKKKKRHYRTP